MPSKKLQFDNPRALSELYDSKIENLKKAENALGVKIVTRDDWLQIEGESSNIEKTEQLFKILQSAQDQGIAVCSSDFQTFLTGVASGNGKEFETLFENPVIIHVKTGSIVPKTPNQKRFLEGIRKKEIVLGIGPAGTGKTYLAVAAALEAFLENKIKKIILTRPAVEAGEALGFLPGDLQEKILPYLRPLYDALYDMLGKDEAEKLIAKGAVEIAPLAYMRGRTLSKAYIILDEAQNTTLEQMIMFLTRLGENSRMIITGDITQVDLPKTKLSGLREVLPILDPIKDIECHYFKQQDVVRHPLVQKIIEAYETHIHKNPRIPKPHRDRKESQK